MELSVYFKLPLFQERFVIPVLLVQMCLPRRLSKICIYDKLLLLLVGGVISSQTLDQYLISCLRIIES